MMKKFN